MENGTVLTFEQLGKFMSEVSMNHQYGIQVYFELDRARAQALLPPPLKLMEPGLGYLYIVDIREPTFAPWYMEGGIGIMAEYNGVTGLHFLGLQLSGPGALMGMFTGRDGSGLPKKLCDRIRVERFGNRGHCHIERGGVRLVDVDLDIGAYNDDMMSQIVGPLEASTPDSPIVSEGGCLLFRYHIGALGFERMQISHYDSPTRYKSWEPATAHVTLRSSADDPWGDLPVTRVLGAGWMVSDNWVKGQSMLHEYPDEAAADVMRYLFSGRYDRCTLSGMHQIYE